MQYKTCSISQATLFPLQQLHLFISLHHLGIAKFKLDVSVNFNVLPIPKKQKSFVITNDELLTMEIRGATSAEIPTALGGDTDTFFDFYIDDEAYEWQAFEGIKQNINKKSRGRTAL